MTDDATVPYLSVVVTTRNDDHGGDLNRRTQLFVDGLAAQAERHRLPTELVMVEWNPPPERPPIAEALSWPEAGPYFEARIITVPNALHRRLRYSDRLPLFQMIAKNVGIRRARGSFVLATNIDVLFSDALFARLAGRQLSPSALYRVDRYDVEAGVPEQVTLDEQLAWCDDHLLRICARISTVDLREDRSYRVYESWYDLYVRLLRYVWRQSRHTLLTALRLVSGAARHPRRMARRLAATKRPAASATLANEASGHVAVDSPGDWALLRRAIGDERARLRLHVNACGDFTLVSREGWEKAGGYPELELFSMHIDSIFLYQAHYSGIREAFLKERLYHIEHAHGFKPDAASVEELDTRLEQRAIPQISFSELMSDIVEMYRAKRPKYTNAASWGLADEALDERRVVAPSGVAG